MTMNKQDYIDELTDAGIDLSGEETLAGLKELYKKVPTDDVDEDNFDEDKSDDSADESKEEDKTPVGEEDEKQPQLKAEVKGKKGKFTVLDSNGKPIRVVNTEEEAESLAKVYSGRIVRG